jgi:cyclic pyranopterin phosphate synthase
MALLDLVLEYDCNLKCNYCTITDEMRRRNLPTRAVVRRIAEAAQRGVTALSITGGEPTIRKDLAGLVRYARERGFADVKVQSNGLMFSYPRYVRLLIDAGVTRFHVSVHGHDGRGAAAYETVTGGWAGTHALMLRGLDNLVAAGADLTADMIVMESTYRDLLAGLADLHRRGVRRFALWLVSLTDQNRANPESLPRISDTLSAVRACLEYGREHGIEVRSLHIPRCLLPGYEDHVYHPGFGEDVWVTTPDADFQLSRSRLGGQVKTERCRGCRWFDACPGVRQDYFERYGDGELTAVRG